MVRLAGHCRSLLEDIGADPQRRISGLSLLTEAERRQLEVEWNATARPFTLEQCFPQLFEAQVEYTPDAVAVLFDEPGVRGQGSGVRGQGTTPLPPPAGRGAEGSAQTRSQESGVRSQELAFLAPNPQSPIPNPQSPTPDTQHPTPNTQSLTYAELN